MSGRDYKRGVRDGEHQTYNPPHRKSVLSLLLHNRTDGQVEDRKDYDQGYGHGRLHK
jgi:hypothetical protein